MAGDDGERPIIIKKVVKGGGGHHGGAWKVAYADFVTAMMAFFLLLWLLNVSTEEARNAISNYFDPTAPQVADTQSGAGGVLGGLTMATEGAMVSDVQPIVTPQMPETTRKPFGGQEAERPPPTAQEVEKALEAARAQEDARFKAAEEALRQAIAESPELKALAENLLIDVTPEGLRIQIVDREGGAMFPSGSARMLDKTRKLIALISGVVRAMPNEISVRGHTDSVAYGAGARYTNWELSADRANATRRVLLAEGMDAGRLNNVMGKADRENLVADDPRDPRNRRISIILLREDVARKGAESPLAEESASGAPAQAREPVPEMGPGGVPIGTFRRAPGEVVFP